MNKNKDIKEYNVYDIENDNWIIDENIELNVGIDDNARSLLVCNKFFVLSCNQYIYIYSIWHDIRKPKLIKIYKIKDETKQYSRHEMCLVELKYYCLADCSFLELSVKLQLNHEKLSIWDMKISEKVVKEPKCLNFDLKSTKYYCFGFECFLNSKNEPIIIIIGGFNGDWNDKTVPYLLFEYNVIHNELFLYKKVKICFVIFSLNLKCMFVFETQKVAFDCM